MVPEASIHGQLFSCLWTWDEPEDHGGEIRGEGTVYFMVARKQIGRLEPRFTVQASSQGSKQALLPIPALSSGAVRLGLNTRDLGYILIYVSLFHLCPRHCTSCQHPWSWYVNTSAWKQNKCKTFRVFDSAHWKAVKSGNGETQEWVLWYWTQKELNSHHQNSKNFTMLGRRWLCRAALRNSEHWLILITCTHCHSAPEP